MDNSFDIMQKALKEAGYRLTPQRKAICQALAESKEHPSAQMVYEQLKPENDTLSLATVYNTLEALRLLGVVNVLGEVGEGGSVRYDAALGPHVNLACVRCHRIIDIDSDFVNHLDQEVEQNSGYALLGARVLYYGICPECQSKEREGTAASSQNRILTGGIKNE